MPLRVPIQITAAARAALTRAGTDLPRDRMRAGVRRVLREAGAREAEVSVTLLGDAEIASLNREYLAHDGPTDVISFTLFAADEPPLGDVYIGADQALRQARVRRIGAREELTRLAVHGALHVLGHDHPEGAERVHCAMWQLQERIVEEVLS
jgi:probable rRNA maturation factor